MLTHPTVDKLHQLRCTGMAKAMAEQLASPQVQNLSFEERLGLLVDRELTERHSRQLTNRLRRARLRHDACIEDIDFRAPRGLDKGLVLSLADGRWVREHLGILITGPAGVGKSCIACALAHSACRHGHNASYRRLPRLMTELAIARADGTYPKLLASLAKTDVLVIDALRPRQAQRREPPRPARDYRRPLWHPLHCDHQVPAGTDAQWSVGETVGVTVTFSEAVDVGTSGGTPSIGIGLGGTAARSATYASGTGTTELVFEYTLVSGDGSHGYMAVTPDSLALNGATIRSAGSGVDALLAHNGALTSGNSERSTGPEASFRDVPKSHDGATAFTVGVQFSGQPAGLSATRDAASVLEVTGGSVTGARVTSKSANLAWEVTVAPDGLGEVTIEVPVRACTEANAVCIGGRSLSRAVETTVPGTRMTARFTQTPSAHDGSNGFELHMEFSHEPENFSYRTVQGALFDIKGGRIERVWRRERGKGRQWGIVVAPDGGGAVTLARLPQLAAKTRITR